MSNKVYEIVTDKILSALEGGTVPWHKPWRTAGGAMNFNSKRPYRGINSFLLAMEPFDSPYWATYKGWCKAAGVDEKARVKVLAEGESSRLVVFWKLLRQKDPNSPDGEKVIPLLRYYNVINYAQLNDSIKSKIKLPEAGETPELDPIDSCQSIIDNMPDAPPINFGGDRAYYHPFDDRVQLPPMQSFESSEAFYTTAFHELGHATGHASRLGRFKGDVSETTFASDSYSKEELVAEMTAAMLCGVAGVDGTFDNSASYISGWLGKLKGDPKLVVQAAAQAQKAADNILGIKWNSEATESDSQPVAAAA